MIKRLAQSIREYKTPTILTLLFIVGEAIIETIIPFITSNLVNALKAGALMEEILRYGLILVLLALISLAFGGLAGFTCAKASVGFSKNLRKDMFQNIQTFSFQNIDKFSTSSLVTRMTTDVMNVQMAYMQLIRMAIRCPLMIVFCIIMSIYMGGKLALSYVVIVPFLGFGLIMIGKFAMPAFHRVFKKYDRLNESVEENLRAMRMVKAFAREKYEQDKFCNASEEICKDFTKAEKIVALNNPIMQVCMYFNMIFVLYVGSKLCIVDQSLNIGQISAMITYGVQVLMSLMLLSMVYVMITLSSESAHRIYEVLIEVPTMNEKENPIHTVENGSISFENVSFKYSEKAEAFSLSDINLEIASGMTVGIIGGTGSSKSTLVQLIPRLYDITEGVVKVGGVDVREYELESLRNSVAMVLQKNVLFAGTIKDNLRWGNPNASDEEMMEACKLAQADEFIQSFPEKYDTWIEQGGTNVSGGQKQRLCIARALLKKPKILILDDSTSAVDTKTDVLIRQGFTSFIPETTKIIIAQRISSVENADLILVMDGGTITAKGTHSELLENCSIYREIYEQQNRKEEA